MRLRLERFVRGVVVGSALVCLPTLVAACGPDLRLGVEATDERLADVVERLATRCGFTVYSTHALNTRVNVRYGQLPVTTALRRLLRQHNFLLRTAVDGRPLVLQVFGRDAARRFGASADLQRIQADLTDADADRRLEAVLDLLDEAPADTAAPMLTTMLDDPDASVRDAAAAALDALTSNE